MQRYNILIYSTLHGLLFRKDFLFTKFIYYNIIINEKMPFCVRYV